MSSEDQANNDQENNNDKKNSSNLNLTKEELLKNPIIKSLFVKIDVLKNGILDERKKVSELTNKIKELEAELNSKNEEIKTLKENSGQNKGGEGSSNTYEVGKLNDEITKLRFENETFLKKMNKTMIEADYRNKYQPEWPGFFLEYSFENYLKANALTGVIRYAQDKSKGGIDLDLYFPRIEMYGDLKAHSSNSKAIQGNDWDTVLSLVNSPARDNHIYYIVAEHDTYKDSDYGYAVTFYWNKMQGKEDLMSYHKRMKNNVELTHAYIFDINADNQKYLSKFRQGINSNGKPREPKIMIDQENFSHFVLADKAL